MHTIDALLTAVDRLIKEMQATAPGLESMRTHAERISQLFTEYKAAGMPDPDHMIARSELLVHIAYRYHYATFFDIYFAPSFEECERWGYDDDGMHLPIASSTDDDKPVLCPFFERYEHLQDALDRD